MRKRMVLLVVAMAAALSGCGGETKALTSQCLAKPDYPATSNKSISLTASSTISKRYAFSMIYIHSASFQTQVTIRRIVPLFSQVKSVSAFSVP